MELFEEAVLEDEGEKLLSGGLLAFNVFTSGEFLDSSPGGLERLSCGTSSDSSFGFTWDSDSANDTR